MSDVPLDFRDLCRPLPLVIYVLVQKFGMETLILVIIVLSHFEKRFWRHVDPHNALHWA